MKIEILGVDSEGKWRRVRFTLPKPRWWEYLLPDWNLPDPRRFFPRLRASGPSGDVALDRAVEALARIASETEAQHAWGLGDDTRLICVAQRKVEEILTDRGDAEAHLTAWNVAHAADRSRHGQQALTAAFNALAVGQGRRKATRWRLP